MGKTFKTTLERKARRLNKDYHAKVKELGLSGIIQADKVNPELHTISKEADSVRYQIGNWGKRERAHSAAHRHSAKKTRKRCGRMNKHSEKREAIEIALDARQKPIKVTT